MPFQVSFYANDVILFICPEAGFLQQAKIIFNLFHGTFGLASNLTKC
jgi:hypothetical protein